MRAPWDGPNGRAPYRGFRIFAFFFAIAAGAVTIGLFIWFVLYTFRFYL
ncbi:hypothetical protein FHX48_000096 [Microbacterium halimionae]|uniref:Uncharacterized protein n=1 Tax=Microbacterium halimionae TaxID=1526413 RepID=A0A7W3JLS0_9MICO|nr:hypothetical protein [Microbacterium halimionae]NII94165.1 hypothetical protein [Microbacterium halimionae]